MNISQDILNEYIRSNLSCQNKILKEMEIYANKNNIPIVKREISRLLTILCFIKKPQKTLEIGTAIGYSTLSMYYGYPHAKIITIEKEFEMVLKAKEYISKAEAKNNIVVIGGDAEEVLESVEGGYDMVFIDAAKAQYIDFLKKIKDKMNKNCLLICDNTLYKGMVINKKFLERRMITIAKRMNKFIKMMEEDKDFLITLLPASDGILIATKIN